MDTPICDFVQQYIHNGSLRLHMPGHKGTKFIGIEPLDITEIDGADSLYAADGIISKSEQNAGSHFGCQTYYSTEGSSHCIRAMLYLALLHAKSENRKPLIAAARNVHKAFLSAAALLDLQVMWLYPQTTDSYLHCDLTAEELEKAICTAAEKPVAVYLTSPDYLGNIADIKGIAGICRKHHILLLVDNAHGAYFKFLSPSQHPIDLGADVCCDSAHKTLPVLTGGAYLHLSHSAPGQLISQARHALSLFGSTSPSYLTLQSLDLANVYLETYREKLSEFLPLVSQLKKHLTTFGYKLCSSEPLKITVQTKPCGYSGTDLAQILQRHNIICEFSDPDFLVLMLTPEISAEGLEQIKEALPPITLSPIEDEAPPFKTKECCMSIREATMSVSEVLPVSQCLGRILADPSVGCPPAVPILVCGERIDRNAIDCFRYYGIKTCSVVADAHL